MDQDKLRELKIQLRRHMNGTTASIMKSLDNAYAANYGLSLQHARDVAASIPLSPDECDYLWSTRWRDFMLIAAAAMAPHDPAPERLLPWAATIPSVEMAEMLPFLLTGKISRAADLALALAERAESYDLAVAFGTLARHIQNGHAADDASTAQSLFATALSHPSWSKPEASALSLLARQCLRHGVALPSVESVKTAATTRNDAPSRLLAQEIDDEQQFLNA